MVGREDDPASFFRALCHFSGVNSLLNFRWVYHEVASKRHASKLTPPKINMEHNNGGLEDDFPFQIGDF